MLSIIIPTRDRAGVLGRSLESVAMTVDPRELVEVIVVDNGSNDGTAETFRTIERQFPSHSWRYFHDGMPGLLSGRHRGARESRGEILCFLDDDVLVAATWIGAIKEAFQDSNIALTGGPSMPLYDVSPPSWLEDLWLGDEDGARMLGALSLIDYGFRQRLVEPKNVWGLNFTIRREVFKSCGGFHPDAVPAGLLRFRGDGETGLSLKIREGGLRALYHPEAAVRHMISASRLTVEAFERRAFAQGISDSYTRIREDALASRVPVRSTQHDVVCAAEDDGRKSELLERVDADLVRERCANSYRAGVAFHEDEVFNDPTLLEWVIKPDYFDYRLPAGWEEHLESSRSHR